MCAITDKLVEELEKERWEDVRTQRMHDVAKREGSADTAKKGVVGRSGGDIEIRLSERHRPQRTRRRRGWSGLGGSRSTSEVTAAKKARVHGRTCCTIMVGGVRLGLLENYTTFTVADQKGWHDKLFCFFVFLCVCPIAVPPIFAQFSPVNGGR